MTERKLIRMLKRRGFAQSDDKHFKIYVLNGITMTVWLGFFNPEKVKPFYALHENSELIRGFQIDLRRNGELLDSQAYRTSSGSAKDFRGLIYDTLCFHFSDEEMKRIKHKLMLWNIFS